ncbi:unnamed protein product, partial [Toxocara canis]|uniref:Transcription factor HIVEP2 n=1 Tax=Toxocara canis TaxID=6265 RepID=A0A183UZN1_TOXCA
ANGIAAPTPQQQQKIVESLLVEQATRNSAHERLCQPGSSQTMAGDNRNIGPLTSPESVKEHISRLISENEAILEQNPGLLKRRPYHRQMGPQSSVDLDSAVQRQSVSPGCKLKLLRSFCWTIYVPHAPFAVRAMPAGGSLTNGQPVLRAPEKCYICNYCQLKFPNEAALDAHEMRCSRRAEVLHGQLQQAQQQQQQQQQQPVASSSMSMHVTTEPPVRKQSTAGASPVAPLENRHPLKRRLLAAVEHRSDEPQASTSKAAKLEPLKPDSCETSSSPIVISRPVSRHNTQQLTVAITSSISLSRASQVTLAQSLLATADIIEHYQKAHPTAPITCGTSGETEKPYILTLSDASGVRNEVMPRRSRLRNITTETFACLNKPQPMFVEQTHKLSMYSNWQQTPVNAEEAKLNLLYMGTCSTKPRIGVKQLWRYTTALREMGALKVTHSSFWDYSTKGLNRSIAIVNKNVAGLNVGLATSSKIETDTGFSLFHVSLRFRMMRLRQNAVATACSQAAIASLVQAHCVNPSSERAASSAAPVDFTSTASLPSVRASTVASATTTSILPNSTAASTTVLARQASNILTTQADSEKMRVPGSQPTAVTNAPAKAQTSSNAAIRQIVGGHRTDEVYVYVRGRGRGRYVCDRCGIRCKKPSMLKKHLKSHTDIRPFKCAQCNFSFKTKGNLTKHLQSKAHRRRIAENHNGTGEPESDSDLDRLEIASPAASNYSNDLLSDDENSSDEEMRPPPEVFMNDTMPYRKFGQENILIERSTHTPPSLWMVGETVLRWPEPDHARFCHSAPPAAHCSPESRRRRKVVAQTKFPEKAGAEDSGEEGDVMHRGRAMTLAAVPTAAVNCPHDTPVQVSPSSVVSQPSMGAFLAKEEMACEMCGRVFRKATELTLHRHTHFLEQQNARARSYQCPDCKQSVRSRGLLTRHIETAHGNADKRRIEQNDSDAEESASCVSQNVNPRSFVCADCNIGFRKHGILAKHLRSKTHVMKLESLGKLPDDALTLITRKENGACLNEVDTTDCDRARASLIAIIGSLRDSSSLECREQMLQSPAPAPSSCYGLAPHKRSPVSSPVAVHNLTKRSPCGAQQMLRKRGYSFSTKRNDAISRKRCDSVSASQRRNDEIAPKFVSANIWIPPKPDPPVQSDRRSVDIALANRFAADSAALSDNGSSVRSDEANSEGAGRSESSTPTQRPLNGASSSPVLPASTRCNLCDVNYETSFDLQVHLHADHVVLRDGKDFRCPKKHCDKVYPNRENLRLHIAAHYHGGNATPTSEGRDEVEGALMVLSDVNGDTAVALHRKLTGSNSSQRANSAPNHSPDVPEESHTLTCPKALSDSPLSTSEGNADLQISTPPSSAEISKNSLDASTIKSADTAHMSTSSTKHLNTQVWHKFPRSRGHLS